MQLAIATQQNNKPLAHLLRFAETVLFANSASTMCERVVSCAGVILTDKGTCLKPERVEKLVYCRMNRCYWEMKKKELGEGKVQAQVESYLENKVGLDEQILSAYEDIGSSKDSQLRGKISRHTQKSSMHPLVKVILTGSGRS
jgi:hypothetical protein